MTPEVYEFVKKQGLTGKTLDIGSFNVNGDVRDLFPDYIGMDSRTGPNVDVVANAHGIPFECQTFDNVVCLEMLEHDQNPFMTISEIWRVLKLGGSVIVTVPGIGFPRHDYPSDYWRFTGDGFRVLFGIFTDIKTIEDNDHVFGIAKKRK